MNINGISDPQKAADLFLPIISPDRSTRDEMSILLQPGLRPLLLELCEKKRTDTCRCHGTSHFARVFTISILLRGYVA